MERVSTVDLRQVCQAYIESLFGSYLQYWRHIRQDHCGAVRMSDRQNPTMEEIVAGEKYVSFSPDCLHMLTICSALKNYVLTQSWRFARFVHEPGFVLMPFLESIC